MSQTAPKMSAIFLGQFNSRYQRPAGNESLAKKTWSCSSHRYHFRLWDVDLKSNLLPLGFPHCSPMVAGNQGEDTAASAVGSQGRSSLWGWHWDFFFWVSICSDKLEKELKLSQILGECGLYVDRVCNSVTSCIQLHTNCALQQSSQYVPLLCFLL